MNSIEKEFVVARKEYIASQYPKLNDCQLEAVLATEGASLILAGAGSGKTTVLINRVANIIRFGKGSDSDEIAFQPTMEMVEKLKSKADDCDELAALYPVEPWRILAITFTNKAADELKSRLSAMLGEAADDIWACTFHSACVKILRRHGDYLGFGKDFTIYDTADSVSLIKSIIRSNDLDEKTYDAKYVLNVISKAKYSGISAEKYYKDAEYQNELKKKNIGIVYKEYMRSMYSSNALDFDDLMSFTVKLLKDFDEVRNYWQRRFRYVLIDEFQDTNPVQLEFAQLLSGGYGNICVVGDDDQSIYKFRGATIENILSFEETFKGCRTIRLEQNYRSTSRILEASNAVIRNNLGRKGKELWTENGTGEPLKLYIADSETDEAQYIASKIMSDFGRGVNWRDNAILYRINAMSNQFEYAFRRLGIPYKIIGGAKFFDRAEVKDILSYLCVILNPSDNLRLKRIINVPARGIGAKSLEKAMDIADSENRALFDILKDADKYPELSRAAIHMREFARMITQLKEYSDNNTPDFLLDELFLKSGYLKMLSERNTVEDNARKENIQEIKTSIINYMKESGDGTLVGYLADVALYTDLDNYQADDDMVVMMTVHSAKGLEFPNVYICGMEETVFPSLKSIGDSSDIEEERRLCYVAMTRAKEKLEITAARNRMLFGNSRSNCVSRFVEEIPDDLIEKKNMPKSHSFGAKSSINFDYPSNAKKVSNSFISPVIKKRETSENVNLDNFHAGDTVNHKSFGKGVIRSIQPMGSSDMLVEIEFETEGTKKMMLRMALNFMQKL